MHSTALQDAPNMSGYVMDLMMPRERRKALKTMARAYRPDLPLEHIQRELAFESAAECVKFLKESHMVVITAPDGTMKMDCKASCAALARQAAAEAAELTKK